MPPPFTVLRIDHLVLRSPEPERLAAFYGRLLGLAIERRVGSIGLIQLRAGESLIDIVPRPEGERGNNLEHYCLRIDPFREDDLRAALEREGLEASPASRAYGAEGFGPTLYFSDPDGNRVELKGPPEAARES